MKYIVYKTTNVITSKIYVGVHKTLNLNNGYLGSGIYLKKDIIQYGHSNFTREILAIFNNPKDMFDMEANIVTEEFVLSHNTYNAKIGGYGGWDASNKNGHNIGNTQKHHNKIAQDPAYKKEFYSRVSATLKAQYDAGRQGAFTGKSHTLDSKQKIGLKNSIKQAGKSNSQFGTCWIYNETLQQSKKVKKETKSEWLQLGWKSGRKLKW